MRPRQQIKPPLTIIGMTDIPRCPFDGTYPKVVLMHRNATYVKCKTYECPLSERLISLDAWSRRGPHETRVLHIPPTEPIFVLRAQDVLAPDCVDLWLSNAQRMSVSDEKLQKAIRDYRDMLLWQNHNTAKVPD